MHLEDAPTIKTSVIFFNRVIFLSAISNLLTCSEHIIFLLASSFQIKARSCISWYEMYLFFVSVFGKHVNPLHARSFPLLILFKLKMVKTTGTSFHLYVLYKMSFWTPPPPFCIFCLVHPHHLYLFQIPHYPWFDVLKSYSNVFFLIPFKQLRLKKVIFLIQCQV